jgi:hypothetical protein
MNRFLDLLDISTKQQLCVELTICCHGYTVADIAVNNLTVEESYTLAYLDLLDPVNLTVNLRDFEQGHSAIEIVDFCINGFEVLPRYLHLASRPTNYIDQPGVWQFNIDNFYNWRHGVSGQGWLLRPS